LKDNILKLAVTLLAAAALVSCGRVVIDPNDYLEYSFSGLDTAASADFDIDFQKMVADNPKAFGVKDESSRKAAERAVSELEKYLCGAPDRSDMLSNGDIISFEWNRDNIGKLEESFRIRLDVTDKEIVVDGLEEAVPFDPFDYIGFNYSGVEPDGELVLSTEDMPVKNIPVSAEPCSGLSNGDKVKIRFGSGTEDGIAADCFGQGYIPECFEKTYNVVGLPVYVKNLGDVDRASYEKMDGLAQAGLRQLAEEWEDKKLGGMELLGAELYTPAEDTAKWGRNALCFVYRMTAELTEKKGSGSSEDQNSRKTEYYSFAYFLDVFSPDHCGGDAPAAKMGLPSYSRFYTSVYGDAFKEGDTVIEGFRSLDDLRSAMTDRFDDSVCESGIEDKEKPE
jgi:hypothetical protein